VRGRAERIRLSRLGFEGGFNSVVGSLVARFLLHAGIAEARRYLEERSWPRNGSGDLGE
jgi:hypothetical protein